MSETPANPDVTSDAAAPPVSSSLRTATRSIRLHGTLSRGASAVVLVLAALVLVGWVFDITLFKTLLHPAKIAMNPMTAVGFALASVSLWLLLDEPVAPKHRLAARVLAAAMLGIGLLKLASYLGMPFQ